MKKVLSVFIVFVLCFTLCSCAYSADGIKSNLEKNGYVIENFTEEQLTERNNELKYVFGGSGSITVAFYGVNEKEKTSVTVLEFLDKGDLTIMYKQVKSSLEKGEKVDLSGYILVFGDEKAVDAALNK